MQYEDSTGFLWIEEQDDDGFVYYVNTNTMEAAWELPPSATEVASSPADVPASSALVQLQDSSASWTEVFDDATKSTYYFNTSTQESSWDLGTDERVASGIYHPSDGDEETAHGELCNNSSSQYQEEPGSTTSSWRDQVLSVFQVPQVVSEAVGRAGSAHIWPRTVAGRPSRLERWDAADPYREHFATGEAWRQEHPEFEPKLFFYAFDTAVEHVERYWVEEAEAPYRCRLQRKGLKFSRDIAKWCARAAVKRKNNGSGRSGAKVDAGDELNGDECWESGGGGGGSDSGGGGSGGDGGDGGGDGAGFFAFPLVVHNSRAHHVDWTSGPDRYQITHGAEPEWGWTRLFSFFAYAASKYHVLETTDAPLAQKARMKDLIYMRNMFVVKGNFLTPEPGWKCVLAFFAFDNDVPGSNRYYIEEKDEPHLRTRVGMEASCRWEARHNFAAFDVPVPGSCALDVHYTIRSTDSLNPYPEQCRISLKARRDPWGAWEQKFKFYAFPAEHVLLSPDLEGSDTHDVYSGS
ncbi:unnamed protein product [Pylaiella littoralis]